MWGARQVMRHHLRLSLAVRAREGAQEQLTNRSCWLPKPARA